MSGHARATLGIISLPDKLSSLSLPMISIVFKSIILPVKMNNSVILVSMQKQWIWLHLTCLLSVTVWSVADVGWCTVFYPWAGAYCGIFLPLWPGKTLSMNGIHRTVWEIWGLFFHGEIWDNCRVLWKPFWQQKIGRVYKRLLKRNKTEDVPHCVLIVAALGKSE